MKPLLVEWLVRHGYPVAFAPDYAMMVGVATILASVLALRQAERDGVKVEIQARALVCAYLAALLGGYVFEWLRAIPTAIAMRSVLPIATAGRAAYGGLIFGALAPALYLRWRKEPCLAFLDRATLGMGLVFACVRFGCFLEGCDFGRPTASVLGVRFPPGSAAAEAHALAGWIPDGAASLPVHPTELYEAALGILATLVALVPLRKGRRDGTAFAAWLVVYAVGRFLLELLRGDIERGRYASLSTAQWVSVAIVTGVLYAASSRRRALRAAVAAAVIALGVTSASEARADEPPPPLPPPTPAPTAATPIAAAPIGATPTGSSTPVIVAPSPSEAPPTEATEPKRTITVRVTLATSQTIARPDIPSGSAFELDALYRIRLGKTARADLGIEGRRYENVESINLSLGLVAELALIGGKHFEVTFTLVPHHTWFDFKSDFFNNTNAYGLRYAMGVQFPFGPVVFGATPLAFTTTSSETVGVISQWEPRLFFGVSF